MTTSPAPEPDGHLPKLVLPVKSFLLLLLQPLPLLELVCLVWNNVGKCDVRQHNVNAQLSATVFGNEKKSPRFETSVSRKGNIQVHMGMTIEERLTTGCFGKEGNIVGCGSKNNTCTYV